MAKLTATHEGQTFTRKTERAYQFVVVSKPNYELAIARAHKSALLNSSKDIIRYYTESAKPGSPYSTDAQRAEYARLAALGTNGLCAEILARGLANVAELKADGYFEKFLAEGWCGRPDLAQKLAEQCRKNGMREVAIVPVNA